MIRQLIKKYVQILALAKSKDWVIIKMETQRKPKAQTSILIADMLTKEEILDKVYLDWTAEEQNKSLKEISKDILILVNKLWRLNNKNSSAYIDHMEVYQSIIAIVRQHADLKMIFTSIQYQQKSSSFSIESITWQSKPFMINIDEDQPESLQELDNTYKMMIKNMSNVESEEDDKMDLLNDLNSKENNENH